MSAILFVCRANQFRSPLAAACLRREIKRVSQSTNWSVGSAGTWTQPGVSVPSVVLQVAHQLDLSGLSRHRTRQLTKEILDQHDLIIVMEMGQKEAITSEFPAIKPNLFLLSEIADRIAYDIPDPASPGVNPEKVANEICKIIQNNVIYILELAQALHEKARPAGQ